MSQPDSEGSHEPDTLDPRELLGEFTTNLWFPRYRTGVSGPWEVRLLRMTMTRGYWGNPYRIGGTVMLFGPSAAGPTSWMLMLPSEIEAQEIGIRAARGHCAVAGLGMGWVAANVALQPQVHRVTVMERDCDIVALVKEHDVFGQLPPEARDKIDIVLGDALEWRADAPVDTLHADIWVGLIGDGKLSDVRRMQDHIAAAGVYFWGQEAETWRAACRRAGAEVALDWPLLRSVVAEDIALPLILLDNDDHPRMIEDAARWWIPGDNAWWRSLSSR